MTAPRKRALELIRRYGRCTVSFQGLGDEFRFWFDGEAVVAYVDTGGAWVAAGGPIAPVDRLGEVATKFAAVAHEAERRACFFAAEAALVDAGLDALQLGEQPVWEAARWPEVLAATPSLRYQVRRARHKGVRLRSPTAAELASPELYATLADVIARWQAIHHMPPMRFLVALDARTVTANRHVLLAERDGHVIAFASSVPVPARRRLFIEDLVRTPSAPNGTNELLVDGVMQLATSLALPEVTLGLAPLAGAVPWWLKIARRLGARFYDFEGLRAFKAKLRPHAWEPVYLCVVHGDSMLSALHDSLAAFAGGDLVGFARHALVRR